MKKEVLIAGGTNVIYKVIAIEFAKNNYNLVINYVNSELELN